jgi:exodeoxyribonuclease X
MVILRVIDFETTGMEPPAAEVIEVGYCDLIGQGDDPTSWSVGDPVSWLCGVQSIPPETRAVHHIRADEVAGLPAFAETRNRLFEGDPVLSAIVAHNLDFEDRFLGEHGALAICTLKAALRVWPDAPSHSNSVLRYWLEDQGLLSLDHDTAMPPHRAGPDAYVTAHILKALLAAGATGREVIAWTQEPRLLPKITFGKHKGAAWKDAPRDYLEWVAFKSDLDGDTKWNAERELERRRSQ